MEHYYDIFISYRRLDEHGNISGRDQARLIAKQLQLEGYRAFFDYSEIRDDEFDKVIIPAIENCKVFILVLTKDALNRCANNEDWVRKEIETALSSGCKIINVTPDNTFNGWPSNLPSSLDRIKKIQISDIQFGQLFELSIKKLINDRISRVVGRATTGNILSVEAGFVFGYDLTVFAIHKLRNQTTSDEESEMSDKMTRLGLDKKVIMEGMSANNMIEQINKCVVSLGQSYGKEVESAVSLGVLYTMSILAKKVNDEIAHIYDEGIKMACFGLGIAESVINQIVQSSAEELENMYGLIKLIIRNLPETTEKCGICGSPLAKDYYECPTCHAKQRNSRFFEVKNKLTDLAFKYDERFEKSSDETLSIDERKRAFMDSAKTIGEFVQLYRDTRWLYPESVRNLLDEKLNQCDENAEDGLLKLIVFVQSFNEEVSKLSDN